MLPQPAWRYGKALVGLFVWLSSPLGLLAESVTLPQAALRHYALDWLADAEGQKDTVSDVKVYSFTCEKCREDWLAFSSGEARPPELFFFAGLNTLNRELAQALLEWGHLQSSHAQRREGLMELLAFFAADADFFIAEPEEWRAMLEARGDEAASAVIMTRARNQVDIQASIVALSGKLATPALISLQRPLQIERLTPLDPRREAIIATLSLPWERPVMNTMSDMEMIPARLLDLPLDLPLDKSRWQQLGGIVPDRYWLWQASAQEVATPEYVNWLARLMVLPSATVRQEAFRRWIEQVMVEAEAGPVTIADAFKVPFDTGAEPSPEVRRDAGFAANLTALWSWLVGPNG